MFSLSPALCPWKPTVYNPIRRHRALLLLEMLNDPVRLERVGYLTAELVVDAGADAVRRHERRVHFHLVLRVAVARLLVPFVLVFAFDGGARVELIGEVFDGEGGVFCRRGFAEASKGWGR